MICDKLSNILGIYCHPLDASGSLSMLETPLAFCDGSPARIFIEKNNDFIRFFDDGNVIFHFLGNGLIQDSHRRTKFIKNACESNGLTLNEEGEIEIWAKECDAPKAFSSYIKAFSAITQWEKDHKDLNLDGALFVEEVAMYLRAINGGQPVPDSPEYLGISGQVHKLDFLLNGNSIAAINPNSNTVSATLKKLVDIKGLSQNADLSFVIVINNKQDPGSADREGRILASIANVWPVTSLAQQSGLSGLN